MIRKIINIFSGAKADAKKVFVDVCALTVAIHINKNLMTFACSCRIVPNEYTYWELRKCVSLPIDFSGNPSCCVAGSVGKIILRRVSCGHIVYVVLVIC